jgi:uncharacterized membrane protein YhfC
LPVPLTSSGLGGLALASLLCVAGPLLVALWWYRRTGASWRIFTAGCLVLFVSQIVLRLPWQIPLARWVDGHPRWLIPFLLISSFTAGLFEEIGRWFGYRYLVKERTGAAGVMFGLGHGGLESILLAGLPLLGLLVSWLLAANGVLADGAVLESVRQRTAGLDFWSVQLATVERISAILLHVGLSLIVLHAWKRGELRWLLLAIGLHFGVNAIAALLMYAQRLDPLMVEPLVLLLGGTVLAAGWRLASRSASPVPAVPEAA